MGTWNMNYIASCIASLPDTETVGCLIAMMYCAAKDGVVHCLQNGSVRYRQEPLKLENGDVLRNAMFSNIIAYNESVFSAMKKIVSLRT